jgi:hypothetical protein
VIEEMNNLTIAVRRQTKGEEEGEAEEKTEVNRERPRRRVERTWSWSLSERRV